MSHRCGWLFFVTLMLAACKPESVDTAPPVSPQATTPIPARETAPITRVRGTAVVTELAALTQDELAVNSSKATYYLGTFFKDGCGKDDGLPFEQSCQHYAEDAATDPSPWPDLALGINDARIVSAVLFDPQQSLGTDWSCDPLSGVENVRACTPAFVPAQLRADWQQRWTAYLNTAD